VRHGDEVAKKAIFRVKQEYQRIFFEADAVKSLPTYIYLYTHLTVAVPFFLRPTNIL
jgi:hypothetical protein